MPSSAAFTLDFELLFSAVPAPHIVLSPDGQVLALNAAMARLPGVDEAARWSGQPLDALREALLAAGHHLAPAEAWTTGLLAARDGASPVLNPDWNPLAARPPAPVAGAYWQATLQPARTPATGELRYLLVRLLDVSEELRARAASTERLQQILAQSPALIATVEGPEHRFAFTNRGYDAMTEHRARLGHPLAECFPELVGQNFLAVLDHVYRTGETLAGQETPLVLVNPATGQRRKYYVDFSYQGLRDHTDQITGVLGFAVDVTDRVLARRQAETLTAEVTRHDQQVRALQASVPVFIFNFNAEGAITYTNPYFYEYTGTDPAGPLDDAWLMLPDEDRAAVSAVGQAAMAAGRPWHATFRCRRRDGELRWFQTNAQPYTTATGQLAGFSAATVEIHELHERTAELARSRTDFATLADNIAQLVWMAGADGRILWYNQQWYDYTGLTETQMLGPDWAQAHHPDLRDGVTSRYLAAVESGEDWEDTFPLRRHDGEYRWFLSRARPIREADGTVVRWFGTNTDVTEQRELQQRLTESEQELRIQAESLPQQVWTAGPDGTVDFYNHRTAAYVGESMDKNGATHWLNFVHPDDQERMRERWQLAISSQRYYEAEFRLRRYDGQYRWFLGQAQARRAPGGQVEKWYGTNTDVHQQRLLQEQVVASQLRFQQLLETLPQMAWTALPDGKVSYYNRRWYDFTGASFAELRDWGWERYIHPDDLADTQRQWLHSLATGQPFECEHRWRDLTGHYRWFLARAEAIRNHDETVALWVGATADVHDFKEAQHQLEAQNNRLKRTNEDLDTFVYTASHDLKQPINNMAGIFEELTRTAYFRDPDAVKLISYFENALARIYATIDDLSAIVQVQRQQQELPAEAVELAPLATEVISSLQDLVRQLGATIELDFATYPVVEFVRPHLQSVFFNLLSNSLKYTAPGRPPVIRLSSAPDLLTGRPVITVRDNGLGIDLDRFGPQMFQLFRRFHPHIDGTGMGLYLVNRIVRDCGGRLEVSSVVNEGSTFQIYL